jgi:hypothetical protein
LLFQLYYGCCCLGYLKKDAEVAVSLAPRAAAAGLVVLVLAKLRIRVSRMRSHLLDDTVVLTGTEMRRSFKRRISRMTLTLTLDWLQYGQVSFIIRT